MGAKKGGKTTRQLFQKENVNAVLQIEKALKIPIKYIHVIRNPYDNIATMLLRKLNKRPEAEQGEKVSNTLLVITYRHTLLVEFNLPQPIKFGSENLKSGAKFYSW